MSLPTNIKVTASYLTWLLATNRGIMGHLYQFTSKSGTNDYFTDLDIDINLNGVLWKSNSLRFEGLQRKLAVGVSVDEQSFKVWAKPSDTMFGSNFLGGAEQGLLDGATIVRYRAIWRFDTGNAAVDVQQPPLAFFALSTGYASAITKGGPSHVEMKVKSALLKLNVNMPRNYYQPGCLWTLFDQGCTLLKASFTVSGTITGTPTKTLIQVLGGISPAVGSDGIAQYAQGRLEFTSGVNNGLLVLIDNNDTSFLLLAYALNQLPSVGDTFLYWPGCSKSYNTCDKKWNNKNNYRGYDKVPPIMLSA